MLTHQTRLRASVKVGLSGFDLSGNTSFASTLLFRLAHFYERPTCFVLPVPDGVHPDCITVGCVCSGGVAFVTLTSTLRIPNDSDGRPVARVCSSRTAFVTSTFALQPPNGYTNEV